MKRIEVDAPTGVRFVPGRPHGVGVLVLAGSSGRVDEDRARVLAEAGCVAESIQWFGGPGQHEGPWEIPLETFADRVTALRRDCDRVFLVGTSFGAEAALATAAYVGGMAGVVAFAPSDVVWAGITPDGRQTTHWTLGGARLPFVPYVEDWEPDSDPPSFRALYLRSREADPAAVERAAIPVDRIPEVMLVVGGDDLVWPSDVHAEAIRERRADHGLSTIVVSDDVAGHRTVLPGEPVVSGGRHMLRGGTEEADRRLGASAWPGILGLLGAARP